MTVQDTKRRVGRKGAVLLILALIDFGVGWSFIHPTPETTKMQSYQWRDTFAPTWAYGMLWVLVGLICLVAAFTRQDVLGFGAAVALKLLWATIEATGWLSGAINQGYRPALVWCGYAALVIAVAGLREPTRVSAPPKRDGDA